MDDTRNRWLLLLADRGASHGAMVLFSGWPGRPAGREKGPLKRNPEND